MADVEFEGGAGKKDASGKSPSLPGLLAEGPLPARTVGAAIQESSRVKQRKQTGQNQTNQNMLLKGVYSRNVWFNHRKATHLRCRHPA